MKATDFAYWLQGYFEINGGASSLTHKQTAQVLEKAESVEAGTSAVEIKAQNFVSYAQGVLSSVSYAAPAPEFLAAVTTNLKSKLNDLFLHAIDPAMPGDQAVNRKAHRPDRRLPEDGYEIMC